MSDPQVQAAQKAASPKEAGSTSTPGTSNSKPNTSKEEAMDTDADQSTQQVTTGKKSGEVNPQRRSSQSAPNLGRRETHSPDRLAKRLRLLWDRRATPISPLQSRCSKP